MNLRTILGAAAAATAILAAGQALAAGANNPPPTGPVILDLAGQAVPHSYTNYTVNFTASGALTDLSFALREDPAFLELDDVSLTDVTHPSGELVTNGGFESGPVGANQPSGWTYLNTFGAFAAGVVSSSGCAHSGSNCYFDGAVQAYDAITQQIATTVNDQYHLSFWLNDNGGLTTFSALSTNGNTTGTGGNGIDLVVYAGNGVPVRAGVPEPATWGLMIAGFAGLGAALRRRRALALA